MFRISQRYPSNYTIEFEIERGNSALTKLSIGTDQGTVHESYPAISLELIAITVESFQVPRVGN